MKNYNILSEWFGKKPIFVSNLLDFQLDFNIEFNFSDKKYFKILEKETNSFRKSINQPFFHIDLFISIAGVNENNENVLVIGEPVLGFELFDNQNEDYKIYKDEVLKLLNNTKERVEQVIASLSSRTDVKFKIIRNPIPLTYHDQLNIDEDSDETIENVQIQRTFAFASYNNCLIEVYGKGEEEVKRIYLPTYGSSKSNYSNLSLKDSIKEFFENASLDINFKHYGSWENLSYFDSQNRLIWEGLGFEVIVLEEDYNPICRKRGGLNCITNCIERI